MNNFLLSAIGVFGRLLLVPLLSAPVMSGCSPSAELMELRGDTMGTTYSVKLMAVPQRIDRNALQGQVDAVLARVNGSMSTYDQNSELSGFNAAPSTEWISLTPELVSVAAVAQRISRESGGAFDVTVGPLVNLWGFGPGAGPDSVPSAEQIAATRALVGFRKLDVREHPPALKKEIPDVYIDLSAIAKGYGVDKIAKVLDEAGVQDYLVEIGGELRGRGLNARRQPWQIAVERPDQMGRSVQHVVPLSDAGMATSGDYRNFFEQDGQRYSHTIDPTTGRPVTHRLASVTVIHKEAMYADAYATALLVLGDERGQEFAESQDLAALFIVRSANGFETHASAAWIRSSGPLVN